MARRRLGEPAHRALLRTGPGCLARVSSASVAAVPGPAYLAGTSLEAPSCWGPEAG